MNFNTDLCKREYFKYFNLKRQFESSFCGHNTWSPRAIACTHKCHCHQTWKWPYRAETGRLRNRGSGHQLEIIGTTRYTIIHNIVTRLLHTVWLRGSFTNKLSSSKTIFYGGDGLGRPQRYYMVAVKWSNTKYDKNVIRVWRADAAGRRQTQVSSYFWSIFWLLSRWGVIQHVTISTRVPHYLITIPTSRALVTCLNESIDTMILKLLNNWIGHC